jgi:hypothetical protein
MDLAQNIERREQMAMRAAESTCRDARNKHRGQMGLRLIDAGQMYLARNKRRGQMGMHVINVEASEACT